MIEVTASNTMPSAVSRAALSENCCMYTVIRLDDASGTRLAGNETAQRLDDVVENRKRRHDGEHDGDQRHQRQQRGEGQATAQLEAAFFLESPVNEHDEIRQQLELANDVQERSESEFHRGSDVLSPI